MRGIAENGKLTLRTCHAVIELAIFMLLRDFVLEKYPRILANHESDTRHVCSYLDLIITIFITIKQIILTFI